MRTPLAIFGIANGLSGIAATLVGFTGLGGGAGRYVAVLAGRTSHTVERATAVGFFVGFGVGCLALLLESTA